MGKTSLKVMTYNIHHGVGTDDKLDLPRIANVINLAMPDVVALQELDRFWARSGHANQPQELADLLGMRYRYAPNLYLYPETVFEADREFGVATFSRYPIIRNDHHLLHTPDGWEQRGLLDTRVNVPGMGEVSVLNTHLQSDANGESRTAAWQRQDQSAWISKYIANLDVPVILMGDFNAEPESNDLDALTASKSGLADAWKLAGQGSGDTIIHGAHGETRARIDCIFTSSRIVAMRAEVIDNALSRMASDHLPLVADLALG